MHPGHCNGNTTETECLRKGGKGGGLQRRWGGEETKQREEKEKAMRVFYRRTADGERNDERNGRRTQR